MSEKRGAGPALDRPKQRQLSRKLITHMVVEDRYGVGKVT